MKISQELGTVLSGMLELFLLKSQKYNLNSPFAREEIDAQHIGNKGLIQNFLIPFSGASVPNQGHCCTQRDTE